MSGLRIGTIAGIPVSLHISWLIAFILLTSSLALRWIPELAGSVMPGMVWIIAAVTTILFFASVLAHEFGHALVAQRLHVPVRDITLHIFGGVATLEREPRKASHEFWIAIAGPSVSVAIGGICWIAGIVLYPYNVSVGVVLDYLGATNLLLVAFNLIPAFPLDGGRVLRAILWGTSGNMRQATLWSSRIGQILAVGFIIFGLVAFFFGNGFSGIWIAFIGWFLFSAAQATTMQVRLEPVLDATRVADIMQPPGTLAPARISVQQLVDGYILPTGQRAIPIGQFDRFVGMVTLSDIARVPRYEWDNTPTVMIMTPLARLITIDMNRSLNDALALMSQHEINQIPVVEGERLIGFVNREAVMRYLHVRQALDSQPVPTHA